MPVLVVQQLAATPFEVGVVNAAQLMREWSPAGQAAAAGAVCAPASG
jgi:hypothetical protein